MNDKTLTPIIYQDQVYTGRSLMEFVEKYGKSGIKLGEKSHLPTRFVKASDQDLANNNYYDPLYDDL